MWVGFEEYAAVVAVGVFRLDWLFAVFAGSLVVEVEGCDFADEGFGVLDCAGVLGAFFAHEGTFEQELVAFEVDEVSAQAFECEDVLEYVLAVLQSPSLDVFPDESGFDVPGPDCLCAAFAASLAAKIVLDDFPFFHVPFNEAKVFHVQGPFDLEVDSSCPLPLPS